MSSSQTSSQKSVSFPVQFSRCAGLSPGPICCRRSFPAGSASTASRRRWTVFAFGFEVSCEPSKRYRQEIQSDALACFRLPQLFNRSYSSSFDSLAVLRTDCSILIDLRSMSFLVSGFSFLPRKEVIQPHLPIRLPCYDFTPVIGLTFGS